MTVGLSPPRDFADQALTRVLLVVPPNGPTCWHEALVSKANVSAQLQLVSALISEKILSNLIKS